MAQQEGGWPLGLQPLNVRTGLARNLDFSGSISFNTQVSGSPTSSTDSSSDLDTESTGSFFHDSSITLGSLIGITSILELSSRSLRSRRQGTVKGKKSHKTRTWFFLCAKSPVKSECAGNYPSLGQFLEVERRASNAQRRNRIPITYELDGLSESQSEVLEPNSLFSNGYINPPQIGGNESSVSVGVVESNTNRDLSHAGNYGIALRFPCMGGEQGTN